MADALPQAIDNQPDVGCLPFIDKTRVCLSSSLYSAGSCLAAGIRDTEPSQAACLLPALRWQKAKYALEGGGLGSTETQDEECCV